MTAKQLAYETISALVQRFEEQLDSYKNTSYNETLTRRDFIDPFFKALGWDMDNSNGYAEAYREVIHEDKVKVGKATKAPDYSFRLVGGKRLFFLEAKKPSVAVKTEIQPAYQVRRYGWSAKLPISIITDFEEFSVYDCTKKPKPNDKASVARIKYLTFRDYLTEFDFLWNTFGKEQVLKGSFDKFVQSDTNRKGTTSVDKEFLQSLDTWRTALAENLAKLNKNLDEDELNFVVQQTIDRIIFLRIAEDRSVEPYGSLKTAVNSHLPRRGAGGEVQGTAYANLFRLFEQADDKYNSGLFDFKKDSISKAITLDNAVVKTIISELYYPESPYEFSVLSVEILGSAYEQFLGKTISITARHKAVIEEKPEVRKAGGVYYTPQYIVDYIVQNTVGKLVEGKTPKEVAKLSIVDPACGSGSFLIGAYQFLLEWHKNYYSENGKPSKGKKDDVLTPEGNLTTAEKKRILLANIYGVDIDVNAVEVTKLSLLLKCMEGETEASIAQQQRLFNERVLPTLDNNIKSGNSLIDTDYYDSQIDFGEEKKIKPFNWQRAFPDVFKKGGFDAVIGNPPYGALLSANEMAYLKSSYVCAVWRVESYLMFIEKALGILIHGGLLGYIIPDTLLNLGFTAPARLKLMEQSILKEIIGLPSTVFSGATVDTILLLTEKAKHKKKYHPANVLVKTFTKKQIINVVNEPTKEFFADVSTWFEQGSFNISADVSESELLSKLERNETRIGDIVQMFSGIKAYEVGKGQPPQTNEIRDEKPYTSISRKDKMWQPFYDGKHIGRYELLWKENNWIKYGKWLAAPRDAENFQGEKILIRKITGKTLLATYVPETSYCNTLLFVLKITDTDYDYKPLLAIINSTLIGWYFRAKFQISDDDTFPQIMIRDILQFPIPKLNQKQSDELTILVTQLLELNKQKQEATLATKREQIEARIAHAEARINQLVYQLYDLTDEEIKIVEGEG